MPPPIPNGDKKSKFIAKEIKVNFRLILIGLLIGACSYPIIAYFNHGFKSLHYRSENQKLTKEFYGYDGSVTDSLTDEQSNSKRYGDFKLKQEQLKSEITSYMPSQDIVLVSPSIPYQTNYDRIAWGSALDNNIKRVFGAETIRSSIGIFLLVSFILIIGRYILKYSKSGIKWVNSHAKE
jgi:hypothetical protein